MKMITFNDARADISAIDDGLVEPILNMIFIKELTAGANLAIGGDGEIFLQDDEGSELMGFITDCPSVIVTRKEVKRLGNSIAVPIGMECKALGIEPGDSIEITIKKL